MKLFKKSVELVVIRDVLNPQSNMESYRGHDVEKLLRQAFGDQGLSSSVRLYHGSLLDEVTPKTPQDVDAVMQLSGRIYAVVKPMGLTPFEWVVIGISLLVSAATAFLMPKVPEVGNQGQPPSPNNTLAARTNQQRLGGRIPDIFGTVWSVPDLIAVTYSVYVDNREVEFSYMCVGRGRYNVTEALDDTTPISQVFGSGVLIYDPDTTLDDTPAYQFGSAFTPDEAELSRLAVKRYTSVNGQILPPPDNYIPLNKAVFRAGGAVEQTGAYLTGAFNVGDAVTIEQPNGAESANGIVDAVSGEVVAYNLAGTYEVLSITETKITLKDPHLINADWQKLADNADYTVETQIVVSSKTDVLWQGWFYTEGKDHEYAMLNIVATNGLYTLDNDLYESLGIIFKIETEIVDVNNNPVSGTLELSEHTIYGNKFKQYSGGTDGGLFRNTRFSGNNTRNNDDERAATAAATIKVTNTHMAQGKRMRLRISRKSGRIDFGATQYVSQEIRIADFYGARLMTAADAPQGVTTVYSKTRATEGALSLKERKLRLLVQRYVTDATSGLPKLSNRADDIIRQIATDPKIGNLDLSQVDIAQIKAEVDNIIAYFGTPLCAEFCGTFDDNNLSAEETIQIVAKAVFSQAKRQGNKIMLDFERKVPASAAVFNSHNILPDTFTMSQSFGVNSDYDGAKVEYTDPIDDAAVTLSYPNDSLANPHDEKLIGVRNKVQAHMHAMRILNRDLYVYKSCEFTAGDESNIVVRTNRITVADQLRADVQQGSVDSIETIGSDIVLHTTDPVPIEPSVAHTLFVQTINNGVESIAVTARDDYSVVLARLPSGEISNGYDAVVQAVYQIVVNDDSARDAYLVTEKSPSDGMTNTLTCTNYDDRYYQNDTDYINGLIA